MHYYAASALFTPRIFAENARIIWNARESAPPFPFPHYLNLREIRESSISRKARVLRGRDLRARTWHIRDADERVRTGRGARRGRRGRASTTSRTISVFWRGTEDFTRRRVGMPCAREFGRYTSDRGIVRTRRAKSKAIGERNFADVLENFPRSVLSPSTSRGTGSFSPSCPLFARHDSVLLFLPVGTTKFNLGVHLHHTDGNLRRYSGRRSVLPAALPFSRSTYFASDCVVRTTSTWTRSIVRFNAAQ